MPPLFLTEARRLPEARLLRLTWNDGKTRDLAYDLLRGWCPCAVCQGHDAIAVQFHSPRTAVDLTAIEPVGNYGLSLAFSDGHGTGIYRFDFLREIAAEAG